MDLLGQEQPAWGAAGLLIAVGVASGIGARRHLLRSTAPLIDPGPWRVETFRLVMLVGTSMRGIISTLPFLLPLLFQLGFGYDPFHAGALVLALFAGNIGIKPATSAILRRFGFRTVLVGNALVQAGAMFGLAAIGPGTRLALILLVLAVAGASRSMQFTALGTLAFADVPQGDMAPANTWFSVSFQLGTGIGVGVGALFLQAAGGVLGGPGLAAFHAAFFGLGASMLGLAGAALMMPRGAGAAVSGSR